MPFFNGTIRLFRVITFQPDFNEFYCSASRTDRVPTIPWATFLLLKAVTPGVSSRSTRHSQYPHIYLAFCLTHLHLFTSSAHDTYVRREGDTGASGKAVFSLGCVVKKKKRNKERETKLEK